MEFLRENSANIVFLTLVGIGIGVIFGLVPLIYGRFKGNSRLGLTGFFVSVAAGAIWSVLPLIVMLVFTFLIIRRSDTGDSLTEPEIVEESVNELDH